MWYDELDKEQEIIKTLICILLFSPNLHFGKECKNNEEEKETQVKATCEFKEKVKLHTTKFLCDGSKPRWAVGEQYYQKLNMHEKYCKHLHNRHHKDISHLKLRIFIILCAVRMAINVQEKRSQNE